ncbi:MAG: cytoskeleton protein RodZ [Saprospiraceae bacterium]|jgi:cytoskeleton protein RodZ
MTNQEDRLEDRLQDLPQSFGPGSVLKAKREEYEWAIESVAQALHLSTVNIRAIEEDRYDQLPGSTYVIGYWRSYARLLGIDLEETIEANKRNLQVVQPKSTGINVSGGAMPRSGDGRKGLVWLALSALILAGLAFAWKGGVLDPKKNIDVAQLEIQAESTEVVITRIEEEEVGVLRKVEEELISKLSGTSGNAQLTTDLVSFTQITPTAGSEQPVSETTPAVVSESSDGTAANNSAAIASSAMTTASTSVDTPEVNAVDAGVLETGTQDAAASVVSNNLLVINLEKDSWLDVRDKSNKRLIYRSGKAGEAIDLRGEPPFYVYIGTPDGVKITYLNQNVPFKAHQSGLFARFKLGEVLENL